MASDLHNEIRRYSGKVGYIPREVIRQVCDCGDELFALVSDDDEGGAFIRCRKCGSEQDIEGSRKYIRNAVNNICNCDEGFLRIAIGVAYNEDTNDPRWVYVGAQCPECKLAGVYVDWQER